MAETLTLINPRDVAAQLMGAIRQNDQLLARGILDVLARAGYAVRDTLPWSIRRNADPTGIAELFGDLAVSIVDRDPGLRKRTLAKLGRRSLDVTLSPAVFERTSALGIPRPAPEPEPYMSPGAKLVQGIQQKSARRAEKQTANILERTASILQGLGSGR